MIVGFQAFFFSSFDSSSWFRFAKFFKILKWELTSLFQENSHFRSSTNQKKEYHMVKRMQWKLCWITWQYLNHKLTFFSFCLLYFKSPKISSYSCVLIQESCCFLSLLFANFFSCYIIVSYKCINDAYCVTYIQKVELFNWWLI